MLKKYKLRNKFGVTIKGENIKMKKFKGLFSVVLLIAAISFIACSSPSSGADDTSSNSVTNNGSGASTTDGTGTSNTGAGTSTSSYIGTKAPTEAKSVGDIVFNDGSAMPYSTFANLNETTKNIKKASAIALIFYKGTELNSDTFSVTLSPFFTNGDVTIYSTNYNITDRDTTTVRTLGVGLKHSDYISWCSDSAQANNNIINSIECNQYGGVSNTEFNGNDNDDITSNPDAFIGDKDGSDNLEQIAAFLTAEENYSDDTTGEGAADRYPAFYFAKNYKNVSGSNVSGTAYESGWYLPSIAELFQIFINGLWDGKLFDINAAIEALGGDTFNEYTAYASSSDRGYDPNNQNVYNGLVYNDNTSPNDQQPSPSFKHDDWGETVCCIREFN